MANEKPNKVIYGGNTLIDLTGDTVNANNLLAGATAHDASGERIQGNVSVPTVLDDLSDVNASSPASGDVLFNDGTEWTNKNITKIVTQAQYDALVQAGTVDPDVDYHISDGLSVQVPIDDNSISTEKVWSSKKVSDSLPITFEFDVTDLTISTAWGSGYESGIQIFDTEMDLTGKKIQATFIANGNYSAFILLPSIQDNTKLRVDFLRFSSGTTISGKLYVMVTD